MVNYKHERTCPGYYVCGSISASGRVIYGVCSKCGQIVERYEKTPLFTMNLKQEDE